MGVRLPAEYQETEWIEGTRNLHLIDTGIPGNRNTLIIEAKVKPGSFVRYCPLWGNYLNENSNVTRLISYNANSILSYINTKANGGTSAVVIPSFFGTDKTFVIRQERTKLTIDGTEYTIPANSSGTANNRNIAINAASTGNPSTSNSSIQRWYYFRIFDGEIILRDFIPCYRKSDMIAGMYDLVSNAFFANARANKTSEFTAGPDVIDSISPWLVARRRMLMYKEPELYPIGTDIVLKYIGLRSGSTTQKNFVSGHAYNDNGEYIETTGNKAASPVYMEVDSSYRYSAKGGRIYHLCYYDKDKNFISYIVSNVTTERTLPGLPSGAKYARVDTLDNTNNWILSITRIS